MASLYRKYLSPAPVFVIRIVGLAWLSMVLIGYTLWASTEREFPVVPAFRFLPVHLSGFADFLPFLFMVMSLAAMILGGARWAKYTVPAVLVAAFVGVMPDIMRYQIWLFQYGLLIAACLFWAFDRTREREVSSIVRYLVIFTYLWSGIHKFNVHFDQYVFHWLMGIFDFTKPLQENHTASWSLAIAETGFALLLAFPRTRRVGVVCLTTMHLIILSMLIKDDWNTIVYPWNLVMLALIWGLFWKLELPEGQTRQPLFYWLPVRYWPTWIFIILVGIMPGFYLIEKWDTQMSFAMYTGTNPEARWYWNVQDLDCLPEETQLEFRGNPNDEDEYWMYLDDWSSKILSVPVYANENVNIAMTRKWCDCIQLKDKAGLEMAYYPRWGKMWKKRIPCTEILKQD